MSISINVYLPNLSLETVAKAMELLSHHGLDLEVRSCDQDPNKWDGYIPLVACISRLKPNRPVKLLSETFETGFTLDVEEFTFESKVKEFKSDEIETEILGRVKRCTKLVTVTIAAAATAGLAIASCFASALAEAGNGAVFDCEAGEFIRDIQSLQDVLQSDLLDDFCKLGAVTVTTSRLKQLCKRLAQSGTLPHYRAFQDLLIRVPVKDALLRCVSFDKSRDSDNFFEAKAVFLPLYVELPAFILTYSASIKRVTDAKSRSRGVADWRLSDEDSVVQAILEADSYFNKASTALEFAQNASKLRSESASDSFLEEYIAGSYAQAGELLRARILLEALHARYWIGNLLGSERDGNKHIDGLRRALIRGANETRAFLRDQVRRNIELLELAGIRSLIEQD